MSVVVLLVSLLSGCHAIQKLNSWNAGAQIVDSDQIIADTRQIKKLAEAVKEAAKVAKESAKEPAQDSSASIVPAVTVEVMEVPETPDAKPKPETVDPMDAIIKISDSIGAAAVDNRDRAILVQLLNGHVPDEPIVINSPKDKFMFSSLAGAAHRANDRSEWVAGLSDRLIKGFARWSVTLIKEVGREFTPGWIIKLLGALVAGVMICVAVMVVLFIRGKMFKKKAVALKDEADELRDGGVQLVDIINQHVERSIREQTKGKPAQKLFYWARDNDLLTPVEPETEKIICQGKPGSAPAK